MIAEPQPVNPDIKAEWVAALRSGRFEQGRRSLRSGDRFCCLGVLCELAVKHNIILSPALASSGESFYLYAGHAGILPEAVQDWAGINAYGSYHSIADNRSLVQDNDIGKTFSEIAGVIEKNF